MKVKQLEPASLQQQTTPMIDVTFQLLTFFMMTLKISSPEGDATWLNCGWANATWGTISSPSSGSTTRF
jgi:hypothetical protein